MSSLPKTALAETNAVDGFLVEAAGDYFEANASLVAFERRIQDACIEILGSYLSPIGRALGKRLSSRDVRPYFEYVDGYCLNLGARSAVGDLGSLYTHVRWEPAATKPITLIVWIWFKDKHMAGRYCAAFKRIGSTKAGPSADETYLVEAIEPTDFPDLKGRLEGLLTEWVEILQQVGPVKNFG